MRILLIRCFRALGPTPFRGRPRPCFPGGIHSIVHLLDSTQLTSFSYEAVVGSQRCKISCSNRRRVVDQTKCEADFAMHSQADEGDEEKSCEALHQSTRQESQLPQNS